MYAVVHELDSAVVRQKITVGGSPLMLHAVSAYVLRFGSPAGTVYLQLQDADGKKIADSESITITNIGSGNHWHGFYRFLMSVALKENTDYYLTMKSSGYSYNASHYVGWCNAYEWKNAFPSTYSPATGKNAPLGMRLWGYSFTDKGD